MNPVTVPKSTMQYWSDFQRIEGIPIFHLMEKRRLKSKKWTGFQQESG